MKRVFLEYRTKRLLIACSLFMGCTTNIKNNYAKFYQFEMINERNKIPNGIFYGKREKFEILDYRLDFKRVRLYDAYQTTNACQSHGQYMLLISRITYTTHDLSDVNQLIKHLFLAVFEYF